MTTPIHSSTLRPLRFLLALACLATAAANVARGTPMVLTFDFTTDFVTSRPSSMPPAWLDDGWGISTGSFQMLFPEADLLPNDPTRGHYISEYLEANSWIDVEGERYQLDGHVELRIEIGDPFGFFTLQVGSGYEMYFHPWQPPSDAPQGAFGPRIETDSADLLLRLGEYTSLYGTLLTPHFIAYDDIGSRISSPVARRVPDSGSTFSLLLCSCLTLAGVALLRRG